MTTPKSNRGGYRPGAGRKSNAQKIADAERAAEQGTTEEPVTQTIGEVKANATPLEFLQATYQSPTAPDSIRLRAAIAAAQYMHTKRSDGGKKDEQQRNAEKVAGKFAPGGAPKLKAVG